MKYAMLLSLGLASVAGVMAGCGDDKEGTTTSSGSSSSSSSSGEGGMGTGGMGTGGMGTGGGSAVCDNPAVVDKDDPAMRCQNGVPTEVVNVVMAPPATVWADKIVAFSTEYGMANYGSTQAQGAPNVYPASGDEPKAWAQSMEDATGEFITVGYSTPVKAEAVWVYETFNPGAISKITITAADGDHVVYTKASPAALGTCAHVLSVSTKTCSPISAVRIDLASDKVVGYNEIDAVGLIPPP